MAESIDLENPSNPGVEVYSLTVRVQDIASPNYSSKYPFYTFLKIFSCAVTARREEYHMYFEYMHEKISQPYLTMISSCVIFPDTIYIYIRIKPVNEFFPVFSSLSYEFNVPEITKGTVSSTYVVEAVLSCWQIHFCSECIFIYWNEENCSKLLFKWGPVQSPSTPK